MGCIEITADAPSHCIETTSDAPNHCIEVSSNTSTQEGNCYRIIPEPVFTLFNSGYGPIEYDEDGNEIVFEKRIAKIKMYEIGETLVKKGLIFNVVATEAKVKAIYADIGLALFDISEISNGSNFTYSIVYKSICGLRAGGSGSIKVVKDNRFYVLSVSYPSANLSSLSNAIYIILYDRLDDGSIEKVNDFYLGAFLNQPSYWGFGISTYKDTNNTINNGSITLSAMDDPAPPKGYDNTTKWKETIADGLSDSVLFVGKTIEELVDNCMAEPLQMLASNASGSLTNDGNYWSYFESKDGLGDYVYAHRFLFM